MALEQPKVFLYLRVSTNDQNVESQKFALLDYCSRQGLQNYEMFIDHGISGAKENRPALNEMMARVEKQECSQVIVFSFSRFARSVSHLLKALQKFKEKNIRVVSTTEPLFRRRPSRSGRRGLFDHAPAVSILKEAEMLRAAFIAALFLSEAPSAFLTGVLLSDSPAARLLENNRASNPTDRSGFGLCQANLLKEPPAP